MSSKCPYCRSPLVDEAGFCQTCGAQVGPRVVYRQVAVPSKVQTKRRTNEALVIALVVILVVLVAFIAILVNAYSRPASLTVHACKLTVTVGNPSFYTDREYRLYLDDDLILEDMLEAGYVVTMTYNMTWLGSPPTHTVSVVWAGGTQTESVQMVENTVVSVSFTL